METHDLLTDKDFSTQFKDCTLNPTFFTHKAHIRLAWIYISTEGIDKAVDLCCDQIKRFDAFHGDGTKFHKTLTAASVRVVYHFFLKSVSDNFADFLAEFPRLQTDFKAFLTAHYGLNIFSSEEAKKKYLEPDLIPFD